MAEAGKENVFLREKCEKCFVEIIDAMISTRKVKHIMYSLWTIVYLPSSLKRFSVVLIYWNCFNFWQQQQYWNSKTDKCIFPNAEVKEPDPTNIDSTIFWVNYNKTWFGSSPLWYQGKKDRHDHNQEYRTMTGNDQFLDPKTELHYNYPF